MIYRAFSSLVNLCDTTICSYKCLIIAVLLKELLFLVSDVSFSEMALIFLIICSSVTAGCACDASVSVKAIATNVKINTANFIIYMFIPLSGDFAGSVGKFNDLK